MEFLLKRTRTRVQTRQMMAVIIKPAVNNKIINNLRASPKSSSIKGLRWNPFLLRKSTDPAAKQRTCSIPANGGNLESKFMHQVLLTILYENLDVFDSVKVPPWTRTTVINKSEAWDRPQI